MGELDLRIHVPNLGEVISAGARVDVLPLGSHDEDHPAGDAHPTPDARTKHGLMMDVLPSESGAPPSPLPGKLKPGRYLVRAELPSGEVLEKTVEITDERRTQVTLDADPTPSGWLAFAQTIGVTRSPSCGGAPPRRVRPVKHGPVSYLADGEPDEASHGGRLSCVPLTTDAGAWERVLSAAPWSSSSADPWVEHAHDDATCVWTRSTEEAHGLDALFIDAPDADWLMVAPRGWARIDETSGHKPVEVALAVARRGDSPAADGPSVYIADPDLAPAMAWMRRGRVGVAAEVMQRLAHVLLQDKVANPCAAALGAYVFCEAPRSPCASGSELTAWIRNLDASFSWLPDGAIAHTLAQLQNASSDEAIDEALATAVRAYERGIPLYTMGVERLLDALLMLRDHVASGRTATGETVGSHDARVRAVRAVLMRMRKDRVFTTIRMPDG